MTGTTYRQFLKYAPGPFALYLVDTESTPQPQVVWLIKTSRVLIETLGPLPLIGVRNGLFDSPSAVVVLSMISLGAPSTNTLFECWMNGCNQNHDGLRAIQVLQSQPSILLHLFDESGNERRALRIDNTFQTFFHQCECCITSRTPWAMSTFDTAKAEIYLRYPSIDALWTALTA